MATLLIEFAAMHPDAVVTRGGEMFVEREFVDDLIDEAERRDIRVLGLEGFLIADGGTYPALSRIADFSRLTDPRESAAAARAVLRSGWQQPPGPEDQMHRDATGRHMLAVVLDDPGR